MTSKFFPLFTLQTVLEINIESWFQQFLVTNQIHVKRNSQISCDAQSKFVEVQLYSM